MAEKRLYVRGFGHNISKEDLEIYFQSRKTSCGGDIESIDFKEDEAIITFEDKQVAKNVSQRSHAIKRTQIEVSSEPFKEESHEASGLQSRTVNIRGLSKDTTQDALQNYLENTRRSGGGEVEEVSITGDSASVKFQLPEVAKRVVEREHSLNGVKLQMTLEAERDSPEEEPRTVEVSGLAACTTKDSIMNYFENTRRSGGGEIEHVQFNPEIGVVLVTFSTAEEAKAVLHRDKHTLDGAVLNVALKRLNVSGHGSSPEEEISQSRTIEISGLGPLTTQDSITNYFENTRRSGGGDIESVEFKVEIGMAVVTFKTAESARGVANQKRHTLDKAELKVVLRRPVKKPPLDSKRLLVKGLSEKTTKDGLESYMEIASKVEVSSVELKGQGRALVTFSETPDLKAINDRLLKRPLDGESLSIEQVPVCHCVLVTGLNNETTKDAIRYHFENPKKGGGEVNNVKFNDKEGWAIVYFEQPQVVTTVLAKSHTLDGAHLQVSPHSTFLEESIPHPDSDDIGNEAPIDPDVMPFIYERWGAEIQQIQNDQGVKTNWQTGSNKITLKPLNKTKTNKKQWDNACSAVTAFIHSFVKRTVSVIPEAWQAVLQKTKDDHRSTQNKVKVDALPQDHAIVLTGPREDVESLAKYLEALKAEIEKEINLESSMKTVVIGTIPGKTLQVLKQHGFAQELQDQYKDVQIDIFPDKQEANIRGPEDTIHKATAVLWQAVASVKEEKLEVSENVAGILRREAGQAFMQDIFKLNSVQAVLIFELDGKKNSVVLVARNADVAHKASALVNKLFTEKSVVLDEEQVQLEKSDKWRQIRDELTEKHVINISFDGRNRTLWIAGSTKDTPAALESVKRFLKENTIVSNAVEFPRGCKRFLAKYRQDDLQEIQRELGQRSTTIKGMADDEEECAVVTGTAEGVKEGVKRLKSLAATVEKQKVPVDKPGMQKMLSQSKGKKMLSLIENETKCVIEQYLPREESSIKSPTTEPTTEGKINESKCSYVTPEGKSVSVFKDDICRHRVDVIVNAANTRLKHDGGLAKAIVEAGGEAIQDECDRVIIDRGPLLEGQVAVTGAGKLPFKKIIHAVGPQWTIEASRNKTMGRTPKEEKLLRYAIMNSLEEAKTFKSVALPAISTGVYGFPREVCAKIMVDATLEFSEENPSCPLSEIHFTNIDDQVVKAFVEEMNSRFANDPSFQTSPKGKAKVTGGKVNVRGKGKSRFASNSPSVSSEGSPNSIITPEGMTLTLVTGDMSREKVDIIVNTTSSDLNLSNNPSAKALSDAAGPKLQQECSAVGKVTTGDIVITTGGNLKCKHVFHTSCASWENGKGEQVLSGIVRKCLGEAQKRNLSSIAIPAIGTGNLGFPRDRVAKTSFDEAVNFSQSNPGSALKEVHFVVYGKDTPSVQAFQMEVQTRKLTSPKPPESSGKTKRRRSGVVKTERSYSDDEFKMSDDTVDATIDPLKPAITLDNITVQAETGDITQETTDAIVTVSNPELDVAYGGGVGKAILKAGGPTIQKECSALGRQAAGTVVATGAGNLRTTRIYHMVPGKTGMASLKDSIINCLQSADSHGMTSISFPAAGTGNYGMKAKEAAKEMLSAVETFVQEQPSSIALVRIVIFQEHMLQDFRSLMEAYLASSDNQRGFFSKFFGWFGFGGGSRPSATAPGKKMLSEKVSSYLEIYGSNKKDVSKAVRGIEEMVSENRKQKAIEHDAISKLSKAQRKEILRLKEEYDTEITIEEKIGRVIVRGDADDVLNVATSIFALLNKKLEDEHTRGYGELLSKNTQWFYYEDENLEPYDTDVNVQIEQAFLGGRKSVIFDMDGARCEIVFKDMKETCLDDEEERKVVRKEFSKGIPLPEHWDAQPKDGSGVEKDVHLVTLDPTKDAEEYKKVVDELRGTAGINISKIERVQNPALYRAYVVRREQMDQKKGSNEKLLFHGTAGTSCPNINHHGFNRSYCGKNATAFGNGVYFARDASYSTRPTYSPPDGNGNRYLYLGRVLVGEYTTGRQGLIAPPTKGSVATDAYDTVVDNTSNPGIFVVFYDNQCYPDYLITFK